MEFHSLNNEIIKTITQHKNELDNEYKILNNYIKEFISGIENKPFNCMKDASDTVNWLRELIVGIKLLNNCLKENPKTVRPKLDFISDKLERLEQENINDETLKIIVPLASMLHIIFSLQKL